MISRIAIIGAIKKSAAVDATAIIACGTGLSTAMFVKSRLQRKFGKQLQILKVSPLYEITEEIVKSVDFVFTTVPIRGIHSEKIIPFFIVEIIINKTGVRGKKSRNHRVVIGSSNRRITGNYGLCGNTVFCQFQDVFGVVLFSIIMPEPVG